ncbi:Cystatin domain [Dillenia turbinata]|uniref:Cystatin domain n=1 Tax=Dillenia turbinata TaxID=194707 RepID=A0AAN8UX11_9MAGN
MARIQILVFLLVPLVLLHGISADTTGPWGIIGNLNDSHVVRIAQFGVSELNKWVSPAGFQLQSIDSGWFQTVTVPTHRGLNFRLDITAIRSGAAIHKYEIIVFEAATPSEKEIEKETKKKEYEKIEIVQQLGSI